MCWLKPIATESLDAGAVQLDFDSETCSGSGSENAPLARWPGSDTLSVAPAAVDTTFAVVDAVYVLSMPAMNEPNVAGPPSVSDRVAGVFADTVVVLLVEPEGTVTLTGAEAADGLP